MENKSGHKRLLQFSIEGGFITNAAREKLFVEKDLASALRILMGSLVTDQITYDERLMLCLQILHGAGSIVGNTSDDSYRVVVRDDIEERPTQLSSIAQLISDMDAEIKSLKEQNSSLMQKMMFLVHEVGEYSLERVNADYYNAYDEPLFEDMPVPEWRKKENQADGYWSSALDSFMAQSRREMETEENGEEVCDYGWLAPDGTFYPVGWGEHAGWARQWLEENHPFQADPDLYWYTDAEGGKHYIQDNDVMAYSLGWVLLDNPHRGLAKVTKDPGRELTKAQKEFLYDYFIERGRTEEANALFNE